MNAQQILDALLANLPLLIGIAGLTGLLGFVAGHMRRGVVEARKAAGATPTKVDDFLVDLVDDLVLKGADLVERGDINGGKLLVNEARRQLGDLKSGKIATLPKGKR